METKIVLVSVYQTILSFKRMVSANLLLTLTLFSQTPATNNSTCEMCNVSRCYFNGGVCVPGSISRLQAMHSINQQCGRDTAFCSDYEQSLDLSFW